MRKTLKIVFYMICLYITVASLTFCKLVIDENQHIREIISNHREIPLSIKEELGLR